IIGISSIVIAFLSLRFIPLLPEHMDYAKLAIAAAGASFGLVKFTWNPSKIMWGFSAMSAGVVLAALSVLISSKIAASILIVLIPFLDAVVTIIRRLLQGKNPLKGDKGHLHHLLLERGWSIRKIAVFYWASTAFLGLVGLWASEKYAVLITLTLTLIVASFIVLLNWRSLTKRRVLRLTE
ncbi:MAG: Undecaprenyl-phosphate alpha-N-acetylglucosaminyltransferase, partial [candidate division WWE3 bacterium GW2011_GWB1_41_6]